MQVGMVGTDGIVLASDTKWVQPTIQGVRSSLNASKIRISYERGIAISCARNMETATLIADNIISGLSDSDMKFPILPIEAIAKKVIDEAADRNDVQCLIVLLQPSHRLFRLRSVSFNGGYAAMCDAEITGKAITGDLDNAAIFWSEMYYERRPVTHLARVAAQLVVMAGKINSGMIGGLEIVLCDHAGFRRLSVDSNARLESTANELDETLRKSFASHAEQFTYAPNVIG
jgi:hypothetical protein